jgi:hypothetical protein
VDVAIVGIGIHPFGRTPSRTGLQQGAYAARLALQDAGVEWKDMQFAFGGSASAGNADALGNELGLTGIPFINVANGCATGGSSLMAAYAAMHWPVVRRGGADDDHPVLRHENPEVYARLRYFRGHPCEGGGKGL